MDTIRKGIICALGGNISVLAILIMFPKLMELMLNISRIKSIILGIVLLIIASLIFQWSVSKPQTQAEQSSVS